MQEKKKVLYIITKGNLGGAQRYVYDLATSLPKDRFEAVVACGDKDGESLLNLLSEKNIRIIKIEGLGREIETINDFKVFRNLIKIIKEEKPNIVHLNSSKIGLLGSLAILFLKFSSIIRNSKFKIHSVFTAHGWAFNEKSRSAFSKFTYYLSHYLTIFICNITITVSEKSKKDMACFPFIREKIKVIYNGISNFEILDRDEAKKILTKKNFSTSSGQSIIFSTSELNKNKGIDVALKALTLLPKEIKEKIIYSVAGTGEEKENLEKLISDLDIKDSVIFLGFVQDAKKLLAGSDIFLMPSRTEAFPYSLLEAGLAGQPIIATCVGGIPEVIKDMQNGILVHPRNPKEIAEAILYFLDHPDKQKEFGIEIKKTVSNFFSLEKMLAETIKLYQ
jgi:glycosyltransferase involved in cell wall biosynthesis